ncbi:MAG: ribosome recycling factor [Eubacterium sp.]|nr:ribosome recycling factor [Eubacterium sp.]
MIDYEGKMKKAVEVLVSDFGTIRAGRANPHILDKIKVDYYGVPSNLQSVANIAIPDARTITITPYESKMVKDIEKAINVSDLGIAPNNDGKSVILRIPELTEDRRKELSKEVKKRGEEAKVKVRNIRRDANDEIKKQGKAGEISEDEQKDIEAKIQKVTDKFIVDIDAKVDAKVKELMTV